jgi:hypothetical protein
VVDVRGPDAAYGRHEPRGRVERGRRLLIGLVLVGIAVVSVSVPPLIAPRSPLVAAPQEGVGLTPASGGVSTSSGGATTASGGVAPAGTSTPSAFVPVAVQAEDPRNRLAGGAAIVACASCEGGGRVRYIGGVNQLVVSAAVPAPGAQTVTVVYETDGPREIKIDLNGKPVHTRLVTGDGWNRPRTFRFTAAVPAGSVTLTFYNDESPAPDIDLVIIG